MKKLKVRVLDLHGPIFNVAILHEADARELNVAARERVSVARDERCVNLIVEITTTVVDRGVIGIPVEAAEELGVSSGDTVTCRPAGPPGSLNYIRRLIKGGRLTPYELRSIIEDVVAHRLSEVEIAGFLLAQYYRGMSVEETVELVRAMVDVGERIVFDEPAYDVHSIGGVPGNSKVALLTVPIVASTGVLIPKTSSRAITSPSGTADTMEVFARVDLTPEELRRVAIKTRGTLAWGGRLGLAPADDIFIRVENPLGIDPRPQMVASILSKKLAMSVGFVLIDIPIGPKAKVENRDEARELARMFEEVSRRINIKLKCALTYGGQPIGYTVGPALEAREALKALMGEGPMSLVEKAVSLAGMVLEAAGVVDPGLGYHRAKDILASGKALEKFLEIVEAQGGDPGVKPEDISVGEKTVDIFSPVDGYVVAVDNEAITLIARTAGAPADKGAGVRIYHKAGHRVRKGEKILTIYSSSSVRLAEAEALARRLNPIRIEGMLLGVYPEE